MKVFIEITGVFFLILLIAARYKTFKYDDQRIMLGIWSRLVAICFLIFIVILQSLAFDTIQSSIEQLSGVSISLLMALYLVYATAMFRYEIRLSEFIWFNGIVLRHVKSEDVTKILFLKSDESIKIIEFQLHNATIRMRNNFKVESLVSSFALKTGKTILEIQI